ncbi:MAG TPA: hypothetical protein VLB49_16450 [Gemmatimonadales bacterium]|nr:hypothetical protein [Gemmatimonadales bacterium]
MRARHSLTVAGLGLLLGACQPQARRLLLLDEATSQPAELDATARPWRDAGYRVEYRRYYPHLTRADLDRYRLVIVLGGRGSNTTADALDVGDLSILTEWTLRGGVVVLGYPPNGEGGSANAFDRWLMNRWLAWSGAGIAIGDVALQGVTPQTAPQVKPVLTAGLRGTGYVPFPAGANNALLVADEAQVLARVVDGASPQAPGGELADRRRGVPVAAASRTGNGLVVVVSRSALGAVRQEDTVNLTGTRAFLVALARFTRRPAEWARIPPSGRRSPLRLTGGPQPVSARSPRASPPAGVSVERLAQQTASPLHTSTELPSWLPRQGLRALAGEFPALLPTRGPMSRQAALDSLTTLLDVGAFNILLTNAHVAPLVDSVPGARWERDALRAAWQQVASRLQATSVRWIPLVSPRDLASRGDTAPAASCPLDAALWARVVSGVRALARLAASHRELIPAVGLAFDETTRNWSSPPFCDAAWQAALAALLRDSTLSRDRSAWLKDVPLEARYDSLLDGGLLAPYDSAVASVVVQRASALRTDLRRVRPDLLFAVVLDRSPADWFTLSLIQGMSSPASPVLVFSSDPRARARLAPSGAAGALHMLRLDPKAVLEGGAGPSRALIRGQDGFWIGPAESFLAGPSDSLARLVRLIGKER